jgi:error-prone DNA polymerase
MGFYHPFTLVKDAQRHGVRFLPADVTKSAWSCTLEDGRVRVGLRYVAGLRKLVGERIAAEREKAPFRSLQDFVDRSSPRRDELGALAEAGALNAFGLTRRSALWQVERAARPRGPLFRAAESAAGAGTAGEPSPLPEMTVAERLHADVARTGLTVGPHPLALHRASLSARGVRRACDLPPVRHGTAVRVAGAVICRQRPGTAKGFMFLTLEDETGLVNAIVRPDLFERERATLTRAAFLELDGVLQAKDGLSVKVVALRPALTGAPVTPARDFH